MVVTHKKTKNDIQCPYVETVMSVFPFSSITLAFYPIATTSIVMNPLDDAKEQTTVPPVPSTSTTKLCTFCPSRSSAQPVKYTCPRCSLQTCSAACSSLHKRRTGCTGERNKVKYVPMNEYGYGALMSDYVYLEEVGRSVKQWGRDIGKGKYQVTERDRVAGGRKRKSKKEALQVQLEIREIPLVLLPPGMEKKKLNQSYWDSRSRPLSLCSSSILLSAERRACAQAKEDIPHHRILVRKRTRNGRLAPTYDPQERYRPTPPYHPPGPRR